jgi:catechol 2,3-dioxygenase-like lactoylglutathione lyase family enzyme
MDTPSLTKLDAPAWKRYPLIDPLTRGVHHLALNTDDMKKTIEFYVDVLGMPLVHAMKVPPGLGTGAGNRGNPPYEEIRHYFFDMGNDSLLGFFEIPAGKEPQHRLNAIGAMQHCAFVVTPERLSDIQERLTRHKVPFLGPIANLPGTIGIYFFDPNGIRLEIDCQTNDGSSPEVLSMLLQTKRQAHAELATLPNVNAEWLKKYTLAMPD